MIEPAPSGDTAGGADKGESDRSGRLARAAIAAERLFSRILDWGTAANWRGVLLVVLIALAVALPGLAALPVTDRDEARFVQATRQMLETGDPIDIRFQDEPRWKKPVGIYWLQAIAAYPLGGTEAPIWAYRLPSAIALVLGALATLWAARPLIGQRGALLAGIALPTCLLAAAEGHIAKTDAALMLTAVIAFGALARTLTGAAGRWTWLGFWLALAAAILIKGPIVPALVLLTLGAVWLARLRLPRIRALRPVPGILLMLAIVLPWIVAIWIVSEGAFFVEAVGRDMIGKIQEGQESHGAPPGLYFLLVWLTLWPWAAFLPQAVRDLWAGRREIGAVLILGWVVPFWLIVEAVPTKLPHYVLPLYPALLIAIAASATHQASPPGKWAGRTLAALMAIPPVLLALAVVGLPVIIEGRVVWQAALLGLIGAAAGIVAARAAQAGLRLGQAGAGIVSALMLYPAVLHFALPAMHTAFPSPRMAALARQWQPCASTPLMSVGYREPSLVFLNGTDTEIGPVERIASRLRTTPGAMVLVEDRWRPALDQHLGADAPELVERARLEYFNYNRGKFETARLLTRDDPRWKGCIGGE